MKSKITVLILVSFFLVNLKMAIGQGSYTCAGVDVAWTTNAISATYNTNFALKVQSLTNWQVVYDQSGQTQHNVPNLDAGPYKVVINWGTNCTDINIVGGGGGPIDTDGDGTPDTDDCQPNNPNLPTSPGSTCNDFNANTMNDVILADGCTCQGSNIDPGGGGGGDYWSGTTGTTSNIFRAGNVAIGSTNNPQEKLEVSGNVLINGAIHQLNFANGNKWVNHLGFNSGDYRYIITPAAANGALNFSRNFEIHRDGAMIKKIDSDGVAMAVSKNGDRNFVVLGNGKVYARDVEVSLNPFPDYVFEDDYKLMPLNELRKYLEINNHLPNFPPAQEIKENGMGLKELNIKQMEKIEELTLYLLELDERLKEVEDENIKLKQELNKD